MNTKKLRVLYLVNIPSPYRVDFFNELGKHCELTVIFERTFSNDRELNWHNFSYDNFNAIFLKGVKYKSNLALSLRIIDYLNPKIYDIIVIGGYSTLTGMFAIKYLNYKKIPFVLNVDGGLIPKNEYLIKKRIKKYFISSAYGWLSTGKSTNEYLVHYGAIPSRIFIYPFTSTFEDDILNDPLTFEEKEEYKNLLNMNEEKVILTVGRFIYSKGFDVLLKASVDIDPDYGIYIVGGEPTEDYLELKRELNLNNVHFIGFKSKEELKNYYLASDLFVLPTRSDVWGLVINEAMAKGLPVITTNKCVAGVELVRDYENGFIIEDNDNIMLAKKINEVITNKNLAFKMSNNSINVASKYTIENMAYEHIDIFDNILEMHKGQF